MEEQLASVEQFAAVVSVATAVAVVGLAPERHLLELSPCFT